MNESEQRRRWRRDSGADVGSFRRQLVVSTAVLGALVAIVLVCVVQVVLAGVADDTVGRVLDDRADAVISSVDAAPTSSLRVPDTALDPGVAVYDDTGILVAGHTPPSQRDVFDDLSASRSRTVRRVANAYELVARPFRTTAGATGVVVVSEPLEPYENDERYALIVSVAAGALIVLLATALAAWASRRALAPVAQMAATAEDWSEHALDRRFDLGPPTNEIRSLGHTLDCLLSRVASAILAEQRLTSELAHELRTPLTAIKATADLVAMRPDLDDELRQDVVDIQESCRAMADTVTGLLDLARTQAVNSIDSSATLPEVLASVLRDLDGAVHVDVRVDDVVVSLPRELAVRAVSPVVHNAVRLGEHVVVTSSVASDSVRVMIADDGPGVAPGLAERIFEPGIAGDSGSGLGLALARRIARSAGGDVTLVTKPAQTSTGATFAVTLPARPS